MQVTQDDAAVKAYYEQQMPDQVEIRFHDTPLYNAIYRFDDEMMVNTYVESYERVWASARPAQSLVDPT
ncbi:hypothetical protein [Promicromonospora sp. NFX87]|uniref:hypothetical protein n=1 Tax=Promicromonospora sp. NFX87 TaxID=3402691 RepID=UPI003AFB79FF